VRDDVAFFQAVRAALVKTAATEKQKTSDALDGAVRRIVSRADAPLGVVDVFTAAGLSKPDITIL
jgi:type I restriction enzyme R subunit